MAGFKTIALLSLLLFFMAGPLRAFDVPSRPDQAVNDLAGVLQSGERDELESMCRIVYEKSQVSLVILLIPSLDGDSIEDLAVRIYQKWGIGVKGKSEGVLILAAIKDRKFRIEIGYGTEGYIPDAVARRIASENIIPHFRANAYGKGLAATLIALTARIEKEKNISIASEFGKGRLGVEKPKKTKLSAWQIILICLIIAFLIFTPLGRRILFFFVISGSGRRGGGGFGGGMSGGGGFGGFGGGNSGGGGSSGSW